MSGFARHFSRRDKKRHLSPSKDKDKDKDKSKPRPDHFGGVFALEDPPNAKVDKEEEREIQSLLERLQNYGVHTMVAANARYAIRMTSQQQHQGHRDGEAAFRLLMVLQQTYEGLVQPYESTTKLLGAQNRNMVTCYLDALLFAMFARLDSYEAMLYGACEEKDRQKLAGALRLWVNMLRKGMLITTDVTRHLLDAMSECGWEVAFKNQQQDPSEAFSFISGKLGLPLLTLKMDLFHTGKEEPQDDHKFVHERLLEVAILEKPSEGRDEIRLEDCLEQYFNNQVEIKRHAEGSRRNSTMDARGDDSSYPPEKTGAEGSSVHIEVAEVSSTPTLAPTATFETSTGPSPSRGPLERVRPTHGRQRGASIFSQRKVEIIGVDPTEDKDSGEDPSTSIDKKIATETEVAMPAWQFFRMLPWYTDNGPTSDAQVAAHFSVQRPVLGICLKRYSVEGGQATRRDTYVDIPLEIAIPKFVGDEEMQENGPLFGNFRLILQSVVCHRGGQAVTSGHYITLCRGQAANATGSSAIDLEDESEDPWMRFDDLAKDRVTYVDIQTALREETPYLLFYQIQPIDEDGNVNDGLPTYAEAISRIPSDQMPSEKPYIPDAALSGSETALEQVLSSTRSASETTDWAPSGRTSLDANSALEGPRERNSTQIDDPRRSMATASDTEGSVGSLRTDPLHSVPSTPSEEKAEERGVTGLLGIITSGSRRGSKVSGTSKSRPHSTDGGNSRFSLNMSMLSPKKSRNDMGTMPPPPLPTKPVQETASVVPNHDDTPRQSSSRDGPEVAAPSAVVINGDTSRPTSESEMEKETTAGQDALDKDKDAAPTDKEKHKMTRKEKAAAVKQEKKGKKKGTGTEERDCVLM